MEKETDNFPYLWKKGVCSAQKTAYLICITDAYKKRQKQICKYIGTKNVTQLDTNKVCCLQSKQSQV